MILAKVSGLCLLLSLSFSLAHPSTQLKDELNPSSDSLDAILNLLQRTFDLTNVAGLRSSKVVRTLKCTFTEVTLPTAEEIRRKGPYSYGKHLLNDAIRTFMKEAGLLPREIAEDYEDNELGGRIGECISGKPLLGEGLKGEGRQHGGGYGHGGGGYGHDPILGFALLGLKVVGGLAAFLAWDLINTK